MEGKELAAVEGIGIVNVLMATIVLRTRVKPEGRTVIVIISKATVPYVTIIKSTLLVSAILLATNID